MAKTKQHWQVVVIGAGPGGYVAAIRCAQLGLKTLCIDEWVNHAGQSSLGGTCLNVGCIPSKALLESSQLYAQTGAAMAAHGIHTGKVRLDLAAMQQRREQVVQDLCGGIAALFKANGVDFKHGRGHISAPGSIEISSRVDHRLLETVSAEHIIIATGSSPVRLPQAPITDEYILDSAAALEMQSLPKRLGIVGAGAIGLELGSVWSRLGSEVVLLEAMPDFLPMLDRKIAALAKRSLQAQGLDIRLNARLVAAEVNNKQVQLRYEDKQGEQQEAFDRLIIAVGRKPNSDRIFGEELGIERDERDFILVDSDGQTSVPHIWAIGDVTPGPMLAHKASEEGMLVAERIAGNYAEPLDHEQVPAVIYTHPEIASVGKTEAACKAQGIAINTGSFPLAASGRARAMGESEGLVKIVADKTSDRVLGVQIFAAQASEMIAQAVLMMQMQATAEDMALSIFAHPTLSESMHEAALSVHGRAIHIKN